MVRLSECTLTRLSAIAFIAVVSTSLSGNSVSLSNELCEITVDPAADFSLSGLTDRQQQLDFISAPASDASQDRSLWLLRVRDRRGVVHTLSAKDAGRTDHELDGDTLTITWRGIHNEQVPGDLTVRATIRLPEGSRKAHWRAEVSGTTEGWLWRFDFPRIHGIRDFTDCNMSVPHNWGRLIRKPMQLGRSAGLTYPGSASMQWLSFWGTKDDRTPKLATEDGRNAVSGWSPDYSDACGLYLAAEDPDAYMKRFRWDPTLEGDEMSWWVGHIPGLSDWPMPDISEPVEVSYKMPYDVVTAVFTGDWHEAANIYRGWAENQKWLQRGSMDNWPDELPKAGSEKLARWTPPWFRKIGFWAKFYHEPAKILEEWAAYRKWLRVPIASHWYRCNIAVFDDDYPEHLPPDPYVLGGVRAARELGVQPLPYVNCSIWDTDTQSWIKENGRRSAVKTPSGGIRPWHIGNNILAWMCLSQEQWQAKLRQICGKLIHEHGMSGVYLDVLAAGSAKACYDPDHGHSIRGGTYWADGGRKLMHDLREYTRRLRPKACFFTEGFCEHLIDVMDGFLTLDITRNYTPGGEQVWPIMTGVYHPYTINFGADADISQEPEHFAVLYGRQLIWGSQPLHSVLKPPLPEEDNVSARVFREYTRAYYVAGRPFLTGGKMLRMAVRPKGGSKGQCGIELAAKAHTVKYDLRRKRRKIWTGPAVLASAWRRFGDIGIVMANITGSEQSVELTVRADLGVSGDRLVRLWRQPAEAMGAAAGSHTISLKPWQAAVYVITDDPRRAMGRMNELEDVPFELRVVEDGPLGSVEGAERSLWASSGGPVHNVSTADGTVATPYRVDNRGELRRRQGRQADVHGHRAEGHGLPRQLAQKPFALLKPLPDTAKFADAPLIVLSGDDQHLLAIAGGQTQLRFAESGLVAVSNIATGELLRSVADSHTDAIRLPEGERFLVGYARFDDAEVQNSLEFGDHSIARRLQPLAESLIVLDETEASRRRNALAAASRQFIEIAAQLRDIPGALSPVSEAVALHQRLNALAAAEAGLRVHITAGNRWLAPKISKQLFVPVKGRRPESIDIEAIGSWKEGGLTITDVKSKAAGEQLTKAAPRLTVDDGTYIERVIPLMASATVNRDGTKIVVSDILRLEANRPYQLLYSKEATSVIAGQSVGAKVRVRNWSPIDLELDVSGSGPRGWAVQTQEEPVAAPALSTASFRPSVRPPKDADRGSYTVDIMTNHATGDDTASIARLPVRVLDALVPLKADVSEWEAPAKNSGRAFAGHQLSRFTLKRGNS